MKRRSLLSNLEAIKEALEFPSWDAMATHCNVPRATMDRMRSGKCDPRLGSLQKVARSFGMTVRELTSPRQDFRSRLQPMTGAIAPATLSLTCNVLNKSRALWKPLYDTMWKQYILYNRTNLAPQHIQTSLLNITSLDQSGLGLEIIHPEYTMDQGWRMTTYAGRLYPTGKFSYLVAEDVQDLVFMLFNTWPDERGPLSAGCILVGSTRTGVAVTASIPCILLQKNAKMKSWQPMLDRDIGMLPEGKVPARIIHALAEAEKRSQPVQSDQANSSL